MIFGYQQIRWGAIVLIATLITPAKANGFNCGLMPLPPLGCSRADARCECDGDGNCHWVFDC